MKMRRGLFRAAVLGVGLTSFLASMAQSETACSPNRVNLKGDWGQAVFYVEVADTEDERARGLMFREDLARNAGMLFVYDRPQSAAFWMKNTLIPLDILFLDDSGTVTVIHEDAVPGDLTPLYGGDSVKAVLEINGGLAGQYGIVSGSVMRHEIFSKQSAIWPC